MQEYGANLPTYLVKVRIVTMALEGEAAEWMVTLQKNDAAEPCNFNRFMAALRKCFKDPPLTDQKARMRIKSIRQGR